MKKLFEVKGNAIYAANAVNPLIIGGTKEELQAIADEMNARREEVYAAESNGESFISALTRILKR